jgi:hypothetical protein
MKWASVREANRRRWPFTTTGLRTRRNAGAAGQWLRQACSRSAPEHDHKLFPRPPTATIIVGNDDPDLVEHLSGDGDGGSGPGSRVREPAPF